MSKKKDNMEGAVNRVAVGNFIKRLRKAHHLTQDQLGDMLFISRKTVSKWETGMGSPTIDIVRSLSDVLNVSLDELLAGEFLEDECEANGGIAEKVLKSPRFKLSALVGIIIGIFFIVNFLALNSTKDKTYYINYESPAFTISRGTITFSKNDCSVNLETLNSDLEEEYKYLFKLYTGIENDPFEEKEIVSFTEKNPIFVEKDVCESIKEVVTRSDRGNLFLKVIYRDDNGSETFQRINLKNYITRKTSNTKLNVADNFGEVDTKISSGKVMYSKEDIALEAINVKFLFDLSPEEIREKFHGKEIEIEGEKYKVEYDGLNNELSIFNENVLIKVNINLKRLSIDDIDWTDISIDNSGYIIFYKNNVKYSKYLRIMIDEIYKYYGY